MIYQSQQLLPCPKLHCGQTSLLPPQKTFAYQFAQECITETLFYQPVDDTKIEMHLQQAYRASGLESPSLRWFDSPLPFISACRDQFTGNSEGYEMTTSGESALDNIWTQTIEKIQYCFDEKMIEQMYTLFRQKNVRDLAQRLQSVIRTRYWENDSNIYPEGEDDGDFHTYIDECMKDSTAVYEYSDTHFWIFFLNVFFEENPYKDFILFNQMVSGYRLGATTAWIIRKPIQVNYGKKVKNNERDIFVVYRDQEVFCI